MLARCRGQVAIGSIFNGSNRFLNPSLIKALLHNSIGIAAVQIRGGGPIVGCFGVPLILLHYVKITSFFNLFKFE